MSRDTTLFKAPESYPEPPKDMWYEVPKERSKPASKLPPIFPWEHNQAPAKRAFPEDLSPVPGIDFDNRPSPTLTGISTEQSSEDSDTAETTPTTPTTHVSVPDMIHQPFAAYRRSNAWDEIPAIVNYVERLYKPRRRAEGSKHGASASLPSILSPTSSEEESLGRRPSLRLTDFPTEDERPSLPVTPAPIRRSSFWGEERDIDSNLPAAEGVPRQQDWDPVKQLEELQRRQSETFLLGPISRNTLPMRELLSSSTPVVRNDKTKPVSVSTEPISPIQDARPTFQSVDFATLAASGTEGAVISPTAT